MNETTGFKMFADSKAQKRFLGFYEMLTDDKKEKFGAITRALFDKKVTAEGVGGFYLTEEDVNECFNRLEEKNA